MPHQNFDQPGSLNHSPLHFVFSFLPISFVIYYFPYKYIDRSRLYSICELTGDMPYIQIRGEILSFETIGEGRLKRLVAHVSDGTGVLDLVWFQGLKYVTTRYKLNISYIIFGKPTVYGGRVNVAHPDIDPADSLSLSSMGMQPYYNTSEKRRQCILYKLRSEILIKI